MSIQIYGNELSGNCQKIIIGCQLMDVSYTLESVPLDMGFHAHAEIGTKSPSFIRLNPRGLMPVIVDTLALPEPAAQYGLNGQYHCENGLVVSDSAAILTYLAMMYAQDWYPTTFPLKIARINGWLAYSSNEIQNSLSKVRLSQAFGVDLQPFTFENVFQNAKAVLKYLDDHLRNSKRVGSTWFVEGEAPTIADLSIFPFVSLIHENSKGELSLNDYPNLKEWVGSVKSLPGFTPSALSEIL